MSQFSALHCIIELMGMSSLQALLYVLMQMCSIASPKNDSLLLLSPLIVE